MDFIKERNSNVFLGDTRIENIYITEYLAKAPGEYVKVFLVISMCAESGEAYSELEISKILNLEEEEIKKAFVYWQELGILKRENSSMKITSLREKVFASERKTENSTDMKKNNNNAILENKEIAGMVSSIEKVIGRPLTGTETEKIICWINEYSATPEIIVYAYAYASEKKKDNLPYVGAIVKEWTLKGYRTVREVDIHLEEVDQKHYVYRRIMKALGFTRNATEQERIMIDAWINEKGISLNEIIDACAKTTAIPNPNLNYVNAVIENKNGKNALENKSHALKKIEELYRERRREAEERSRKNIKYVADKYPEILEINEEIRTIGIAMSREFATGGHNKIENIEKLKIKLHEKERYKKEILTKNNIPIDYDSIVYSCNSCKDTGTRNDGSKCICYEKTMKEVNNE